MDSQTERRHRFESLMEAVFEPLQRYLARRVPAGDAEDVLSEALATIWRRLDDVPTDEPLPWCYGVARLTWNNYRRGSARRHRLESRVASVRPSEPAQVDADPDGSLEAALDALPAQYREVLTLWAWEQLEPREIARVLGTSANTVSLRLGRAKARLEKEMRRQRDVVVGQKMGEKDEEKQW